MYYITTIIFLFKYIISTKTNNIIIKRFNNFQWNPISSRNLYKSFI